LPMNEQGAVGAGSFHPPHSWGHSGEIRVTIWGGATFVCVGRPPHTAAYRSFMTVTSS
jgi:hypothetical protein